MSQISENVVSRSGQHGAEIRDLQVSAWNRGTYDTLAAVLGATRIREIAQRFRIDLASRLLNSDDHRIVRSDAHVVVSAAGMLGFVELSDAMKNLENACIAGFAITPTLQAAAKAKSIALQLLDAAQT